MVKKYVYKRNQKTIIRNKMRGINETHCTTFSHTHLSEYMCCQGFIKPGVAVNELKQIHS